MNQPYARLVRIVAALAVAGLAWSSAHGQEQNAEAAPLAPSASNGGKAELLPPRPLAAEADPLNRRVAADTVDGLILTVTIDGDAVVLDSAVAARVPRKLARAERDPGPDAVKATALANGQVISTTVVPDTVINAQEDGGLVRTPRRQIALVLATDRPADTVAIEAPATGARASLDVRSAYAEICRADPRNKWCARGR
jgi:hypothetical protein